ncbi:MAG TPA: cupredoxin domain-containing protein [Blastocatellia bacterium]|nr:cupredoxin domain-containing protein [Blastocatellia bacterium]
MKKTLNMILVAALATMMVAAVGLARPRKAATAARAATVTVKVSSFQFTPKTVTVAVGTTVEWVNSGGRHTVEADDGSFKSDTLADGAKFSHTFTKAGKYPYHCSFHGDKGGKDMAGTVVVK